MHMADALISPAVGGAMLAVSAGVLVYAARDVRNHFRESRVPLMGVSGAFVFAAQMVNFAIPGTGSSGHIGGAVLLAALLGPSPAFVVMACVLLVQALFFADGGLLAWGCNLFNLGFFGCFVAYPYLFRPIAGQGRARGRLVTGALVACVASLTLGALAVTVQTLLSDVTQLPFGAFAAAMIPIHLAIGLGEGLATAAVLLFVRDRLPDAADLRLDGRPYAPDRLVLSFGLSALIIGGGLSLLASGKPDGLEWSLERTAGTAQPECAGAVHAFFADLAGRIALLSDYAFPGRDGAWGTAVAGIVGAVLCAALLLFGGCALCRHAARRRRA